MVLVSKISHKAKESESKEGRMKMVKRSDKKSIHMAVIVKGYKNRYCHYIIICRDVKSHGKEVFLNLNKCKVSANKDGLQITQDNADGESIILIGHHKNDSEKWLEFMSTPKMLNNSKKQQRNIMLDQNNNCLSALAEEDEP